MVATPVGPLAQQGHQIPDQGGASAGTAAMGVPFDLGPLLAHDNQAMKERQEMWERHAEEDRQRQQHRLEQQEQELREDQQRFERRQRGYERER